MKRHYLRVRPAICRTEKTQSPHTPGNLHGYQNKELARKAVRKVVKTKHEIFVTKHWLVEALKRMRRKTKVAASECPLQRA